jgi:hypothetical protein
MDQLSPAAYNARAKLQAMMNGDTTSGKAFLAKVSELNANEPKHLTKGQTMFKEDVGIKAGKAAIRIDEEVGDTYDQELEARLARISHIGGPKSGEQAGNATALPQASADEIKALVNGKKRNEILQERVMNAPMQPMLEEIKHYNNNPTPQPQTVLRENYTTKMNKGDMIELLEEVLSTRAGKALLKDVLKEELKDMESMIKPIILGFLKELTSAKK